MKLMKHITIALVLCAIPAVAVGQTVSCDDCTHSVSVYMGEGGLIAETDADEVTYVATCNGVTRTGELEPNDDGMVSMLLAGDLACHGDDEASFDIGPVMDGGWYWLTMETNSAVGGLVSMDVLENDTVDIADAGEGVTTMAGKGAVLLTETATGRVGLLPNILPEPPAPDAVICGPRQASSWPFAWDRQMTSSCMLGGGKTKIRLVGPGAHGSMAMITNGMVYRPNAGSITVMADLWVDESGSYTTDTSGTNNAPAVAEVQKGWIGKTASASGAGSQTNWLDATFTASVNAAVGAPVTITSGTPVAGIDITETGSGSTPTGRATFTVVPDSAYCSRTNNHTAVLNVVATPGTNAVHPPVAVGRAAGFTASALAGVTQIVQLRVVCPPASSSAKGQELVPDNPFPVE